MATIIPLTFPYVILSACCNVCETTWTAKMRESTYTKFLKTNEKYICPFCGNVEVGLAINRTFNLPRSNYK